MKSIIFPAFAWVLIVSASPCFATTLHVPQDFETIGGALSAASAGDTISVAGGVYPERGLQIAVPLTLSHAPDDEPASVTIDAAGSGRILTIANLQGSVVISGIRFVNSVNWDAGTVFCSAAEVELRDCVFADNWHPAAGGLACRDGAVVSVNGCRFDRNGAISGGAIHADGGSSVAIRSTVFTANESTWYGGSLECRDASLHISQCTFDGGASEDGVVYLWGTVAVIENSCFTNAEFGTAFGTSRGDIKLACCNIFGNAWGDWVDGIGDQFGIRGNISEDPRYCGAADGNFTLDASSPMLPQNNTCGVLMGALGQGCGMTAVPGDALSCEWALSPIVSGAGTAPVSFEVTAIRAVDVALNVYDVRGRSVRAFSLTAPARVFWDGRDHQGGLVPSGRYFCVGSSGGSRNVRPFIVVR